MTHEQIIYLVAAFIYAQNTDVITIHSAVEQANQLWKEVLEQAE